jgi:hypothetical protein
VTSTVTGHVTQDLIDAAKASASDYVYERTGKRVLMSNFEWQVGYVDGRVSIVINGLTPSDVGELAIAELVAETVLRTQRFATDALALLLTSNDVDERLEFEGAVIDGILAGFQDSGYQAPLAALARPKDSMFGRLFDGIGGTKLAARPDSAIASPPMSSGGEAEHIDEEQAGTTVRASGSVSASATVASARRVPALPSRAPVVAPAPASTRAALQSSSVGVSGTGGGTPRVFGCVNSGL